MPRKWTLGTFCDVMRSDTSTIFSSEGLSMGIFEGFFWVSSLVCLLIQQIDPGVAVPIKGGRVNSVQHFQLSGQFKILVYQVLVDTYADIC